MGEGPGHGVKLGWYLLRLPAAVLGQPAREGVGRRSISGPPRLYSVQGRRRSAGTIRPWPGTRESREDGRQGEKEECAGPPKRGTAAVSVYHKSQPMEREIPQKREKVRAVRRLTTQIAPAQEGAAVQTILRRELGLSAAAVRRAKALAEGILLDGVPVFTNVRVTAGQVLSVAVGDQAGSDQIAPVPGPLTIVYEDEDLVVVDKVGGVAVHPSQGHYGDTLANFLMAHYAAQGLVAAFHPVNRLDRGTSGLMAVAKHAHAHEKLQEQLQSGRLHRTYLAVCEGVPVPRRGCVDAPIARAPGSVLRRQVCPQGAEARTHYEVLRTGGGRALVHLRLDTGRTHQIRVHLAHLGCPLAGDFLYGTELPQLPQRFALHSAAIQLCQPVTGQPLSFASPLPAALENLLTANEKE